MNWLAHLFFSEPTPEFRMGNLLPDMASVAVLEAMPSAYQDGIARHRQIDTYTDNHPIFRQSVRRLPAPYRRYGGVLIDVFYDHFLAAEWELFSDVPLHVFAAEVYASFTQHEDLLPAKVRNRLAWIAEVDLLSSYREIDGISAALDGISGRLRRPLDLTATISILEARYTELHEDFHRFIPDLEAFVAKG